MICSQKLLSTLRRKKISVLPLKWSQNRVRIHKTTAEENMDVKTI